MATVTVLAEAPSHWRGQWLNNYGESVCSLPTTWRAERWPWSASSSTMINREGFAMSQEAAGSFTPLTPRVRELGGAFFRSAETVSEFRNASSDLRSREARRA
jgi:hypothetical protein